MSMNPETLAGIRLLICMAKADGVLQPDERFSLEDELAGISLPEGLTIDSLLAEKNDPHALAAQITSQQGRDYVYAAVLALAYCDRHLAEAEERLLDILRLAWGIKKEEDKDLIVTLDLKRAASSASSTAARRAVNDPEAREAEFNKLMSRYALLAGLTGAIPVPLIPDLLVLPLQMRLVYEVAALFGTQTSKETMQLMFETLGIGTGCRLGISALMKLVPGWGSLVGATTSFATTYALGKVAYVYYKNEGKTSIESLKPMFKQERLHGKEEFQKHREALQEAEKTHSARLQQLAYDLQAGRITQQQYELEIDKFN